MSNADTGGGGGVKTVSFRADRSKIIDSQESNLRVANVTPVKHLDVMVERTDLSESATAPVLLEDLDTSKATTARLDLSGGALGSVSQNCIYVRWWTRPSRSTVCLLPAGNDTWAPPITSDVGHQIAMAG